MNGALTWDDVRQWRRETRKALIDARRRIARDERARCNERITETLEAVIAEAAAGTVGLYWPMQGEFNTLPLAESLRAKGIRTALPAIVEKNAPLTYRPWDDDSTLEPGVWNIPTPVTSVTVVPDLVLAPVVGFAEPSWRLGFGGGYFDRTLAAMTPKPAAVGVGYELGRLETIHPQPHDIPLNMVVTEAGRHGG